MPVVVSLWTRATWVRVGSSRRRGGGGVLAGDGELGVGEGGVAGDVAHALAVGAVGEDEQLVLWADDGGEDGLDAEGAAALHEDGGVGRLGGVGEGKEAFADALGDALVVVIPGAVVKEHLALDGVGGGEGTGREEFVRMEHGGNLWGGGWVGKGQGRARSRAASARV